MQIEINYQAPEGNEAGFVVRQRLVREGDIVMVDPKPGDPTRCVMRIKESGSQYVAASMDLTIVESYAAYKARIQAAPEGVRIIEASAVP